MNIVMLGNSSAGKTTYMAALYYRMTNGLYDYKMRYDQWANYWYKHYILNNQLYTLTESTKEENELNLVSGNLCKGIYPPPTAIRQEYVFKMRYRNFNEIEFNWFDYRGGALMERSNQSSDTADLISKITNADALVVFLDGTKLEEPIGRNERNFRRIVYLVKSAISNIPVNDGVYFPISFVITKDDICNNVLDSEGFTYFWNNILNDISQSNKVAALITWATINRENIYNVQWPLFFSINHCMYKFMQEVISSYQSRENNRGFFDSICEWWTDDDKKNTRKVIDQLQESSKVLQQILDKENRNSLLLI